MTTSRSSLERAIRDEVDNREEVGGALLGEDISPSQLDLLRGPDGKLPANVFQLVREQEGEARRGPGRPKGAKNRESEQLAKLIVQKHGCPVDFMASLYSRPIDQLIELVLIADSTAEREERLMSLIENAEKMISAVMNSVRDATVINASTIEALTNVLDRVFDAAKSLKMKPGDLAIKAINVQLAAARATAEYTARKKPVAVDVSLKPDAVLVMAAANQQSFEDKERETRLASDLLAQALRDGRVEAATLEGLRLQDGQLIQDGEWTDVDPEGEA